MSNPANFDTAKPAFEQVVFFADGVVIDESTAAFAAGFVDAPDVATSRVLWRFDDGWASDDVEHDFVVCLAFSMARNQVFGLGRNGWVRSSGGAGVSFEFDSICGEYTDVEILGASDRGVMSRIRAICDSVFACGWGSQIYKLTGDEWVPFEQGLVPGARHGFLDINGPAEDDLHAIGMDGVIAHFDGKALVRISHHGWVGARQAPVRGLGGRVLDAVDVSREVRSLRPTAGARSSC
ncbi:hypothetical protein SAMN02745121_08479 [Nannocystis exedens]|uniref:Uncharacterized protein n=1 Tax=Nannocystis exedens TaxID=54 RepID=A0A1I2I8Q3_9BACT|nr:hypothetical protein [Nannocystis exedens]PCC74138.1 hypothetical protein NAEX_07227 [Nannocystis exedens]SFF37960.1 hypothetical protein SAMN02745121_08479 [Nannocystis exedens]